MDILERDRSGIPVSPFDPDYPVIRDSIRKAGRIVFEMNSSYRDEAEGTLGKDERGKMSITEIVLRPAVTWSGDKLPDAAAIADLHHRAHDVCYIANSVRAEVKVEPR